MRNRTYGGVRGRKTKVGRKLLRFPPTRLLNFSKRLNLEMGGIGYVFTLCLQIVNSRFLDFYDNIL